VRFIEHAGRIPAERDTLYNVVRRCDPVAAPAPHDAAPVTNHAVGWVDYSNARPLVAGLDGVTLRGGHPSDVARWLADGEVQLALVPVGALLADPAGADWRVVPDVCIGCDGPVDSVLLAAATPPEQWRRVLLDGVSRTSVVLARLLLEHGPLADRMHPDLEIIDVPAGTGIPSARGDTATVVIGDLALNRPSRLSHTIDLGAAWHDWTGLPFVFAVWAGHPDLDPAVVERVRAAGVRGMQGVADGSLLADTSEDERLYLTHRIRYPLDDRATMGLLRFAAMARRAGLVDRDTVSLYDPPLLRPKPHAVVVPDLLAQAVAGDALDAAAIGLLVDHAPLTDLMAAANLRRAALHPGAARTYTTDPTAPAPSTTATLRYGAGETASDLAQRMVNLRENRALKTVNVESVDQPGAVVSHANNTAVMGLRLLAVARLALPNLPHIQASWRSHGRGLAQLAQHAGADDFGAVLPRAESGAMVDGVWPMTAREAERNLRLAGLHPQPRDHAYGAVQTPIGPAEPTGRPMRRLDPPAPSH
jgi:predicted solute-binding protein